MKYLTLVKDDSDLSSTIENYLRSYLENPNSVKYEIVEQNTHFDLGNGITPAIFYNEKSYYGSDGFEDFKEDELVELFKMNKFLGIN